jgi:hypothetical protein
LARFHIVNNELRQGGRAFQEAISVNNNSPMAHTEYGKFLAQSNRAAGSGSRVAQSS